MSNLSVNKSFTHEENRHRMCLICKRKPKKKDFKITGKIGNDLKILFPTIDLTDSRLPAVVCDSCRLKITRAITNQNLKNALQIPDYSNYCNKMKSRAASSTYDCECTLCNEVRSRGRNFDAVNLAKQNKKSTNSVKKIRYVPNVLML